MRSVQSNLFALVAASSAAFADTTLNLTQGVSPISHDVYDLHMAIFWICVVIGLGVFSVMFYSMIYHRKSLGVKPAEFHHHTFLEIAWTIIPALILVVMTIPATKVLLNMNNYDHDDVTIKVTGYQWKWQYEYMEEGIKFFSNLKTPYEQIHGQAEKSPDYLREVDKELHIPIHKKIRFLITSNDVNHSWWVPDFAVKRDAIGGIINEGWTIVNKPGIYRGQCAELCGINHAFMPIVVVAESEQDYQKWVAKQKNPNAGAEETNRAWTMDELMKQGQQTYNSICAACHQPTGLGNPPTFPALKGSKVATGPISEHVETVFNGRNGTAMQAFKNQLSDVELAAVITYERNAWGNNTNTSVQPIQIKALRDGKSMADALATQPGAAPASPTGAPAATTEKAAVTPPPASPSPEISQPATSTTAAPATNATATATTVAAAGAPSADDLKAAMARGEKIYLNTCAACHQPAGLGLPPTFPALKGSPIATGPLPAHIDRVMNGKTGTAMVAFRDQYSDQDIADVITYERNAWGNNMGTLVKADDIKAARKSGQNNK